jgi:hypothetical protein
MMGANTVNDGKPVAGRPPAVTTTTLPVVAPTGTPVMIEVGVQLVTLAATPLNVTAPSAEPKFVPVIVTLVPAVPDGGESVVVVGARITVNVTSLLAIPPTVTTTYPDVAPIGTRTTIDESVH